MVRNGLVGITPDIGIPAPRRNSDGTWGGGNVWLYRLNGSYVGNRYRSGAAIYKARPVVWSYR